MNSDRILNFFSLVNYSFFTGNIHSKIGQIVIFDEFFEHLMNSILFSLPNFVNSEPIE
jgi:hypothetical protein